jgi:hypothetical protein
MKMNLRLAQALWVLGLLHADQLPVVATTALEAGADGKALRVLAGLLASQLEEAPDLFAEVLKSLGVPTLSLADAARLVAVEVSEQLLRGELNPTEAAERLWEASIRVGGHDFHDLDPFIYAASECKSRPAEKDFFEREIVNEAKRWAMRKSVVPGRRSL